ncbi:MAG: response regulator [Alphaproteobacteria bacterium]|uniref:Response regulator n=1 Tax=Candidatus Nitrobium versatile TaxID=2884831 RepID=A0A953M2I1_9BACT|nr:response regulator [Candidatus Nitrobium versatile]
MLIDDVSSMRRFIKSILERTFPDCFVDEANDGISAREKMEMVRYDLVLCDWGIPGLSGEDLLLWVRKQPHLQDIPFIMVTGFRDKEHVVRAKELGVSDYIVKPIAMDVLIQKIKEVNHNFKERSS